jgi:hypothetical protein
MFLIDRSRWLEPGPWDNEPDVVEWTHMGVPCLIVRNHIGALCGYAGVKPDDPLFSVKYQKVAPEVHGGVTYSGFRAQELERRMQPSVISSPIDYWFFGFDCNHSGDYAPGHSAWSKDHLPDRYHDIPSVRTETERLAECLFNMSHCVHGFYRNDCEHAECVIPAVMNG